MGRIADSRKDYSIKNLLQHAGRLNDSKPALGRAFLEAVDHGHREVAAFLMQQDLGQGLDHALIHTDRTLAGQLLEREAPVSGFHSNMIGEAYGDDDDTTLFPILIERGAELGGTNPRGQTALDNIYGTCGARAATAASASA